MPDAVGGADVCGQTRRTSLMIACLALACLSGELRAQNIISVPFTNGFIGTRGSAAGTSNNVLTYATLGIAKTFFVQSSSTTTFELQGNDIPGTLRIVRTNGTTLDIPASANWRNSGGATFLIGILPRPVAPITFVYSGGSIQITDGSSSGGSSVGGYVAAYAGAVLADAGSTNGNAAQSQVLSGLNDYLTTVVASRPVGPVTVNTLTTTSTTPTIAGTATLAAGENLSVVLNGVQYTTTSTPAAVRSGNNWSLALTSPLAVGTYAVTATVTNADGFTLSDATTNELVIANGALTLGGSFTANNKTYDGTTPATGTTTGLTLVGVIAPDQVTIASVTLGFQTATAGAGKTVVITAVTLGGANAGTYSVSLTAAPTTIASITAKALTIGGVSAVSKVYDGATTATLSGTASYVGLANGETFAVTGNPAASFGTAVIGTGKPVTVTGYTAPSVNYSVTQPVGLTANITARPLTISGAFTAGNKISDGTTTVTITTNGLTLTGIANSDDVSLTGVAASFADAAVGTAKVVSLSSASLTGAAAGNYAVSLVGAPTTTADITTAGGTLTLGGNFTANDKTYDGTTPTTGTTTGLTLVGITAPDQVTIASVTLGFQTAAAGTGTTVVITAVTLAGVNAGTYSVSLSGAPTTTASITAKALAIGGAFTAGNKISDGTTTATITTNGLTLTGIAHSDDVSLTGVAASFADATVGTAKVVSLSSASLTGAAAGNYTVGLVGAPTTTANITTAGGTVTLGGNFAANDKTYNGTTPATGTTTGLTLVGVTMPDQVTIASVTLGFQTATVGAGKTVVITAVTLGGANAGTYGVSLTGAPTTTATITTKSLTVGGSFTAANKTFDGTTASTIATNNLTLIGVVSGDSTLLIGLTSAFASAAVGTNTLVALSSAGLSGSAASNYSVSLAGAPTTTANIVAGATPSAPRNAAATVGDGSLAITWVTPDAVGCRAITGYVVEYSADQGQSWTRMPVSPPSPTAAILPRLVNDVAYLVRVAAINQCGTGAFSAIGPVVPMGPSRDAAGHAVSSAPGTASSTSAGVQQPVTISVVQDTIVRVTGGDFTVGLRANDQSGSAIPLDSSRIVQLEYGGRATADGSGFAPGTYVSVYLFTSTGEPVLLGSVAVGPDGVFTSALPIPATLVTGNYTLQVNGLDRGRASRSVGLGVEVVPPPSDLVLVATPDQQSPMVGDTITITLTVTNRGSGPATNVVIPRAFKEPGFAIMRTTPLDGTYDAVTLQWTIGDIEPGAHARMLLTVVVLPPVAPKEPNP
jgi:hypothetical protein